tara:strand:- start:3216 stop:4205 length:990 start_codon:yes stop_codon:yes gene_type:complete
MQNTLENFIENTNMITYENTIEPIVKKNKVTNHLLADWPLEERLQKFFEFCRAYDVREEQLLKENPQQFSHRLHWDEMPYVDEMKNEEDLEKLLHHTIVWSFSNEHWLTFRALRDHGINGMKRRFETQRHARSDLFQIYYPKGTVVREWLCTVPQQIAKDCHTLFRSDRKLKMMELATLLERHTKENYGFRNVMYPYKNLSRHIAMARPDLVDPESWVTPGTLSFYGIWQLFGGKNLFGKTKFKLDEETGSYNPINTPAEQLIEQFNIIAKHPDNPMERQYNINIEDKACMWCKHLFIRHGVKSTTKKIPYNWIYPENFSLKKHVLSTV